MEAFRVDPRVTTPEAQAAYIEQGRKLFAFNQTVPFTPENIEATKALFGQHHRRRQPCQNHQNHSSEGKLIHYEKTIFNNPRKHRSPDRLQCANN
jgi:hypothetical protein